MAYTATLLDRTVYGNHAIQHYFVTADGATGTITTGLSRIINVSMAPASLTSGAIKFAINEGVTGTSIAGSVSVTGVTSGDEFYMTVYGS